MLHNTTRERLLQTQNGHVALVIDALYSLGWQTYHTFKACEAIELVAQIGVPAAYVRIALKHVVFRAAGRRGAIYSLPAPSTARKEVQGTNDDSTRDELELEDYKSLKAYRMALHRALLRRKPRPGFRAMLARRIGVCKNTTRNYERALGIRVTNQYRYSPIDDKILDEMPANPPPPSKRFLFIKHKNKPFFASYSKTIALFWLLKGVAVQVVEQIGSLYEVTPGAGDYYSTGWENFVQT